MSGPKEAFARALAEEGWALAEGVLPPAGLARLEEALAALPPEPVGARRGGQRHVLEAVPAVAALARGPALHPLAEAALGPGCFAVRALLFDKTPERNWKVRWHQDLTVTLQERREAEGFGPFTVKGGVVHAHAPRWLLERMVALRLHLDPCGEEHGPVRVIPRSHRGGVLPPAEVEAWRAREGAVTCTAAAGDVLAFHPLLLHASSPALRPSRRRVLHLEYAAAALPGGLAWHARA